MGNPERAEPDWPPVVVAGGYITGIVLMRNLIRRGLRVCCIDCNPAMPAFRSVYGRTLLCPNPDDQPEEWARFMAQLAVSLGGRPVLIASADQFVSAIATNAEALDKHYLYSGTVSMQALLATKERQYEIASSHGLPTPRTSFIRNIDDIRTFTATAQFPALVKPNHFREWQHLPGSTFLQPIPFITRNSA